MNLAPALVVALAFANSDPAEPPNVDQALAAAVKAGQPLVIELSTTWCHPCKRVAEKMLPDPRVQQALKDVTFISYDAENGVGVDAETRFGNSSYPTFVVIDATGVVRQSTTGMNTIADLLAFLGHAALVGTTEPQVVAHMKQSPTDAAVLLTAGRWFAFHHRVAEATAAFDRAQQADRDDKLGVGADAAWARAALERRGRLAHDLGSLVRKFPRSANSESAAYLSVLSGDLTADEARAVVHAYVDANAADADRLLWIVAPAIAAGALDDAERAATVCAAKDASNNTLLAEVLAAGGRKEQALSTLAKARAATTDDVALLALEHTSARFSRDGKEPSPVVEDARASAEAWFSWLATPSVSDDSEDGSGDDGGAAAADAADPTSVPGFIGFMADALTAAGQQCAAHKGAFTEAWVRIDLKDAAGPPKKVTVLDPDAPAKLRTCLVAALAKAPMPAPLKRDAVGATAGSYTHGRYVGAVPLPTNTSAR